MSHRALITGVAGFVGGYLAEQLLARGDAVLGCSLDGNWEPCSAPGLCGLVELVAWDIGDGAGLTVESRRRIVDFRPDRIYHMAALSVPADSGRREPTAKARAINVEGTRRVLELAAALAPAPPRVLVVSSSHVYEHRAFGSRQIDEQAPLAPEMAYGQTKLAAEQEARRAARQGVDVVIARTFQHTGPRQNARMMLPEWARQVAAGGDGPVEVQTCDAYIDVSDVRDVVRAYGLLLEHGRTGETYNVGSGIRRRSGDVLRLLLRAAGQGDRAVVERSPGKKFDAIADISRVAGLTGWQPEIALETTVADTLAWWRDMVEKGEVCA